MKKRFARIPGKHLLACPVLTCLLIVAVTLPCVAGNGSVETGKEPGDTNFDTWILLQNPGDDTATGTVEYIAEDGDTMERPFELRPYSRTTMFANETVESASFSTKVTSDKPIIAERSEYFDYGGSIDGGHAKPGIVRPSREWYFAEGYTGNGFEEWILVQNPNDRETVLDIEFMKEDGTTLDVSYTIKPKSRFTLEVNAVPGIGKACVSAHLKSALPVFAERAMYFLYNGNIKGGSVVPGARASANQWLFAEGYTGEGFDTWLLLMNPNDEPIDVYVYFDRGEG